MKTEQRTRFDRREARSWYGLPISECPVPNGECRMEQFPRGGVEPSMSVNPVIWSIWIQLSYIQRSFWILLCLVSLYTIISGTVVFLRVRALRRGSVASSVSAVSLLKHRCDTIQHLVTLTFYCFGFLFFLTTQQVTQAMGDGHSIGMLVVLGFFLLHCAFAANVFAALLVLQGIQWIVSSRVRAYEMRLGR